ncbi:MAG: hypothetical protein ACXVJT_05105 [Thermoanaerobaculia bacterium]
MEKKRKQLRTDREQLLTLVNQWDPVRRLEEGASRDSYSALVDRLFSLIADEPSEAEIAAFLEREVREEFGTDAREPARFATKVFMWSRLRSPDE